LYHSVMWCSSTALFSIAFHFHFVGGLSIKSGDEQELLSFERRLLKQIQGLTDRCPTIAVYSLFGAIPITTQIEKNTLTTFYNKRWCRF
jgi:hypothetical protein